MKTNRRVVGRDTQRSGDDTDGTAFQVDGLHDLRVFRLQRRYEVVHARTDCGLQLGGYGARRGTLKRLYDAGRNRAVAIVVDQRVPENAVKPGHGALVVLGGNTPLAGSDDGRLIELFRFGDVASGSLR